MKVRTFMGKVNMDALQLLDDQINAWLEKEEIEPKNVTQAMGIEKYGDMAQAEPVVVISVWY